MNASALRISSATPTPLKAASRIVVRHAEPGDADALHAIFTDPAVTRWLVEVPYAPIAQIRRLVAEPAEGRYTLVACDGGTIAGALGLHVFALPRLRHVGRIGPVAVSPAFQGRGIGAALMASVIDLADNWINLVRLELGVIAGNRPARALYERHGFVVEGVHRAYGFQAGRYVDVLPMARVRGAAANES